jgi:hypothetical protein
MDEVRKTDHEIDAAIDEVMRMLQAATPTAN